jgi:hypothetical protein
MRKEGDYLPMLNHYLTPDLNLDEIFRYFVHDFAFEDPSKKISIEIQFPESRQCYQQFREQFSMAKRANK